MTEKICKRAKDEPEATPPHVLHELPIAVVQNRDFKVKGKPVIICENCDGGAWEDAAKTHELSDE